MWASSTGQKESPVTFTHVNPCDYTTDICAVPAFSMQKAAAALSFPVKLLT